MFCRPSRGPVREEGLRSGFFFLQTNRGKVGRTSPGPKTNSLRRGGPSVYLTPGVSLLSSGNVHVNVLYGSVPWAVEVFY